MSVWLYLVLAVVLAVLLRHRRLRRAKKALALPLAGIDTGARSPWRVPGRRRHTPHRGF